METPAQTTEMKQAEKPVLYDADANNRLPYEVNEDGKIYDTAHIFKSLPDEEYLEFLNNLDIKGNENEVKENGRDVTLKLWDKLIIEVENLEVTEGENWKDLISDDEKIQAINDFLAVAPFEEEQKSEGKRRGTAAQDTRTVFTEAWFNSTTEPTRQAHVLRKSDEYKKKFARIEKKQFQEEKTRGLRGKPKIQYVPQDQKFGELYDEMLMSSKDFASFTPLRFKTAVVNYLFAPKLSPKKSRQ